MPWQEEVRGGYPDLRLLGLPGIDILRSLIAGESPRPPISHMTGMILTQAGDGTATFTMPATPWLTDSHGVISVGTLAMLADGPLGCAVHSVLGPATGYVTTELSLRALAPLRAGGELLARGRVLHGGDTLALSSVQITGAGGRLLADGSSLCLITPLAPPPDEAPAAAAAPSPAHDTPDPFERAVLGDVLPPDAVEQITGLELLQAQIAGELPAPPLQFLTGIRPVDAGPGEAAVALPCREWLCSPLRTVEGGAIAMLAEAAITSAIRTTARAGTVFVAIDLKVNFLRPVLPDDRELLARARVRHPGRTIAIGECDIVNADDKPVALATGSAMALAGTR